MESCDNVPLFTCLRRKNVEHSHFFRYFLQYFIATNKKLDCHESASVILLHWHENFKFTLGKHCVCFVPRSVGLWIVIISCKSILWRQQEIFPWETLAYLRFHFGFVIKKVYLKKDNCIGVLYLWHFPRTFHSNASDSQHIVDTEVVVLATPVCCGVKWNKLAETLPSVTNSRKALSLESPR